MVDSGLEAALDYVGNISRAAGGYLEFLSSNEDTVKVRYLSGKDELCEECVMSSSDIKLLLLDSLKVHAPHFTKVIVVSE